MKKILLITLLCLTANFALSLPVCHFEHYSTDDGLPQFSITDIIQDRKGFMWFATWDGFSKFDGYTFRNFKVRRGDAYQMNSNRIQHIYEDRDISGCIPTTAKHIVSTRRPRHSRK